MRRPHGNLHLIRCSAKGLIQVKVSPILNEKKARKWMWGGLAAFVALQIYFVQEMLAALMLFTGVFAGIAIVALILYLVDRAGPCSVGWAGQPSRPPIH